MKLNTFNWLRTESVDRIDNTNARTFWTEETTEDRLLSSEMRLRTVW